MRVSLQLDDVSLEGHLAIPENSRGVVIFAHGSGSSRHSPRNRSVAKRLNEARLATLLFDLLTEEEQARDQASGQFRFDILLLGPSACQHRGRHDGTSGNRRHEDRPFWSQHRRGSDASSRCAASQRSRRSGIAGRPRPDLAWEALPQVTAPTLLIVGELDHAVIEFNQRAYAQLQSERRLDIVTGATHLFEEPGTLEAVADLATQWFAPYLKTKDARSAPTIDLSAEPDRRTNMELPNKRQMIQAVIDEEQEPWIVMKPSRQDPADPEPLCIFENPAEQTQAKTEIPVAWFQNRELQKIKEAIKQSLRHAEAKI